MNKSAGIVIGLAVILAVGGVVYFQSPGKSSTGSVGDVNDATIPTGQTTTDTTSVGGDAKGQTYAMAEVKTHNSESSCWSAIDNNVYDLTSWIPKHPGGRQAIIGLCGNDGTAAFHGQHDDNKRQADILATMKIGALSK